MSDSPTPETDAEAMDGISSKDGEVVPAGWLARVRKGFVSANRGAEKNAKVNKGLCARLAEVERERDEAREDLSRVDAARREEYGEAFDAFSKVVEERDEARRELAEIMSCIEQAIDHHKGHQHFNSVFALMNLLDNINKRRKHDPR